jgi:hypothetical protein
MIVPEFKARWRIVAPCFREGRRIVEQAARETIRQKLGQAKTFLAQEAPPRLSEADTKAHFIEPVIAALGWEGLGVVTREYYVKNSQEFIDYVMTGPKGRILAIEAKPLQTDLTEKHAAQLIQYCAVEGIEWAALTNGRELQFFNTFLKPDLTAKRVLRLDLLAFNSDEEFDALFAQVWQLSRESMTAPAGVRTWLHQRRLDAAIREHVLTPSSATIRQLRKALAEAEIAASPQDLAQWFRTHLSPAIPTLVRAEPAVYDRPRTIAETRLDSPKPYESQRGAPASDQTQYLLTPLKAGDGLTVREVLERLLGNGWYVFGDHTPGRKTLKPGDQIAFYESGVGVVAQAEVASVPERRTVPHVRYPEKFPWAFGVRAVRFYFDAPIALDADMRARLDAFRGRSPDQSWAWFVQQTHRVNEHDFALLVGRETREFEATPPQASLNTSRPLTPAS